MLNARRKVRSNVIPSHYRHDCAGQLSADQLTVSWHRSRGSCTVDGWTVTWVQERPGSVRVTAGPTGVKVVIGDDVHSEAHSTTLLLSSAGATVRAASAPPGLLVGQSWARTVPGIPGIDDFVTMSVADRLLVLSADALDALPLSRPREHRPWVDQVSTQEPDVFLEGLFRDLDGGSGAILTHSR
jgi:hypothetical protein